MPHPRILNTVVKVMMVLRRFPVKDNDRIEHTIERDAKKCSLTSRSYLGHVIYTVERMNIARWTKKREQANRELMHTAESLEISEDVARLFLRTEDDDKRFEAAMHDARVRAAKMKAQIEMQQRREAEDAKRRLGKIEIRNETEENDSIRKDFDFA